MKKILMLVFGIVMLGGLTNPALAGSYSSYDSWGSNDSWGDKDSSDWWNKNTDGCPTSVCGPGESSYTTTNSEYFWFDKNNLTHSWNFDISPPLQGGDTILDSLLTIHFAEDFDPFTLEKADISTENGGLWSGFILFNKDISAVVTAALEDFKLTVTVTNQWIDSFWCGYYGDFGIKSMDLDVCYVPGEGPASVPEPGTLLLLGSGLTGLVLYRRRKQSK